MLPMTSSLTGALRLSRISLGAAAGREPTCGADIVLHYLALPQNTLYFITSVCACAALCVVLYAVVSW